MVVDEVCQCLSAIRPSCDAVRDIRGRVASRGGQRAAVRLSRGCVHARISDQARRVAVCSALGAQQPPCASYERGAAGIGVAPSKGYPKNLLFPDHLAGVERPLSTDAIADMRSRPARAARSSSCGELRRTSSSIHTFMPYFSMASTGRVRTEARSLHRCRGSRRPRWPMCCFPSTQQPMPAGSAVAATSRSNPSPLDPVIATQPSPAAGRCCALGPHFVLVLTNQVAETRQGNECPSHSLKLPPRARHTPTIQDYLFHLRATLAWLAVDLIVMAFILRSFE